MIVLFCRKRYLYLFLIILLSAIIGLIFSFINPINIHTYKDRDRWENSGDIVWEIKTEEKLVALTFDDGPDPIYTPQIIELLKDYDARASFFVVGNEAEKHPEIIKKLDENNHEIANHTYSHREVTEMTQEELIAELLKTHQIIFEIINKDMNFFRPTSGFYNDIIVDAAKELDYKVVIWTWGQDSRDWQNLNYKTIANNVYKSIQPGNIILFHDRGGKRDNTIKALHIILPILKEKGYDFVTISELLEENSENI